MGWKWEREQDEKAEKRGRDPGRRLARAGPGCVKCLLHGDAVDNSRAEGWSMLTCVAGGRWQAPRSHRHAAEARFARTGHRPRPAFGPAGPLSIPIDAAVESTLGPVYACQGGENPGFWRRQGGVHLPTWAPGGQNGRGMVGMVGMAALAGGSSGCARPGSLLAASWAEAVDGRWVGDGG